MKLSVVVVFLNEEAFLPTLLRSISSQTRLADELVLVDDGSTDESVLLARAFSSEHPYARVLERPQRSEQADRLATASELRAFQWAVEQLVGPYDVVAKLDGDLDLAPDVFERVIAAVEADPKLGIVGTPLSIQQPSGRWEPEHSAPWHVRGATKFYRRECYSAISPLPPILGWDTIDEIRAAMHGWRLAIIETEGDSRHLRTTGSYDGRLRGFRRRGVAAWGYGAHPVYVLLGGAIRMRQRPFLIGGLTYLWSWLRAALSDAPRAERDLRVYVRREEMRRLRQIISHRIGGFARWRL